MNSAFWLAYFQQNRSRRVEPHWHFPSELPRGVAGPLARSLSHFQLGESGEGSFLLAEAMRTYSGDPQYCEALALFIREEQEHARLLAELVRRFGGALITKHWTHAVFRILRRALGVQFEIQILVIAELVGTAYYRLLRRSAKDLPLEQVCDLVLRDEAQHIAFHVDRFAANQAAWLPFEMQAWAGQFQALFLGATQVAWLDHRPALFAMGHSRRDFVNEARRECVRFLATLQSQRNLERQRTVMGESEMDSAMQTSASPVSTLTSSAS